MSEAGPRFKVALGPNGSQRPPYVGALSFDAYRAQSLISAPRATGDADFEMHDLKGLNGWHRHDLDSPNPSHVPGQASVPGHHTRACPPLRRCGQYVEYDSLICSGPGGIEQALSDAEVLRERSNHARGAYVRSLGAIALNGLSLCDHPGVGSVAWWAAGYPHRHAQRANLPLAVWAAAQGLVPPAAWAGAGGAPGPAGQAGGAAGPAGGADDGDDDSGDA